MAFIQDLATRHDVQRQVAEVHRAFADERLFRGDVREVGRRADRVDALERLGLAGVDLHDTRMGMRRAEDLPPQHPRHPRIGRVHRSAGDLVDAIGAQRTRPDDFQV